MLHTFNLFQNALCIRTHEGEKGFGDTDMAPDGIIIFVYLVAMYSEYRLLKQLNIVDIGK
jgi:hypothetical protein